MCPERRGLCALRRQSVQPDHLPRREAAGAGVQPTTCPARPSPTRSWSPSARVRPSRSTTPPAPSTSSPTSWATTASPQASCGFGRCARTCATTVDGLTRDDRRGVPCGPYRFPMTTTPVQRRRVPRPATPVDLVARPATPGTVHPEPSTPRGPGTAETGGTPSLMGATPPSRTEPWGISQEPNEPGPSGFRLFVRPHPAVPPAWHHPINGPPSPGCRPHSPRQSRTPRARWDPRAGRQGPSTGAVPTPFLAARA